MKKPKELVLTSDLERYDVVNPEGKDLGQVQDLVLDMKQGRIALVVVSFGGTLVLSDKWFALPWDRLRWTSENKKFVMNVPREVLEKAPGLSKSKYPQELDFSWMGRCYEYYGCTPYWTEGSAEEQTKKLAYDMWEREERPEGKHLEHYYRAEKILKGAPGG